MHRVAGLTLLLFILFHAGVDASVLPFSASAGTVGESQTNLNYSHAIHAHARHHRRDTSHPLSARALNAGEIPAYLDPSALPEPWPLGVVSILISLATGHSNYKTEVPDLGRLTKIGWAVTLVRTLGLGLSAILHMRKNDYTGVSSDGFLCLFTNIAAIMAANRDYGEKWWARGGVLAMLFGLCPMLVQISLFWWKPDVKKTFAPFRWTDGSQCIIDSRSSCDPKRANVPACLAPVLQPHVSDSLDTPVDIVRILVWYFALGICAVGLWRLFTEAKASIYGRRGQVYLAYLSLVVSVTLVLSSAIIYGRERRETGLDCRALTTCIEKIALDCPSITVVTPASGTGFFREWAKELTGMDIPGILV